MGFRFLAAIILLGSIVTLAQADYILIRINLKSEADRQPPKTPPAQPKAGQPPIGEPSPKKGPVAPRDGDFVMAVVELTPVGQADLQAP